MSQKLFNYPLPYENPMCVCDPVSAFFCMTGHLTECHSGMNCDTAKCSHLLKYDNPPKDYSLENSPAWVVLIFYKGEKIGVPNIVYAPTAELAQKVVEDLIPSFETLSRLRSDLTFETRPATLKDLDEFEKLRNEYAG